MTLPLPDGVVDQRAWELERQGVQRNFDALALRFPLGPADLVGAVQGTSLPASPVNGQDYYYIADSTAGVTWHLKYRSASSSAYKWEPVGATALTHAVNSGFPSASETTSSTSYVDLATVGPTLTVPLAGDYDLQWGVTVTCGSTNQAVITPKLGAAAVSDVNAAWGGLNGNWVNIVGSIRTTGLAALTTIKLQYKSSAAASIDVRNRWLRVTPVRVS